MQVLGIMFGILYIIIPALLIWLIVSTTQKGEGVLGIVRVVYMLSVTGFLIGLVISSVPAFGDQPQRPEHTTPPLRQVVSTALDPGYSNKPVEPIYYDVDKESVQTLQEETQKQWDAYEAAMDDYHQKAFFISYPCGILLIILGVVLRPRLSILKPGIILGGLGSIIYAISQDGLSNEIRFAGIAIALAVIIFVAYKTLLDKEPQVEKEA